MLYLVTYQQRPRRDPKDIDAVLRNGTVWWQYLDTTWLVVTSEAIDRLTNRLYAAITKDDYLLVVSLPANFQFDGWLPQEAWNWIKQHRCAF